MVCKKIKKIKVFCIKKFTKIFNFEKEILKY